MNTPMPSIIDAESIIAFALELNREIERTPDSAWTRGSRYDAFGGFTGWWNFLSRSALCFLAYEKELRKGIEPEEIDWVSLVDNASSAVFRAIRQSGGEIDENEIERLIRSVMP